MRTVKLVWYRGTSQRVIDKMLLLTRGGVMGQRRRHEDELVGAREHCSEKSEKKITGRETTKK